MPALLSARSTSENVTNAVPLLEQAERIKIVSNPLHGQRARLYLQHQRPDLAQRTVRAADYRPGEWTLAKPFLTIIGLPSGAFLIHSRRKPPGPYPLCPLCRKPGIHMERHQAWMQDVDRVLEAACRLLD